MALTFQEWTITVQTLAQLGTLIFLIWYALETFWIRKAASKQTEMVSAQLKVMQETLQRQVASEEASDEPRLLWVKDHQMAGFMWKLQNVGGAARFLEVRSSHGTLHLTKEFLANGENCFVNHDFSDHPNERNAAIEFYGLKYQSDLGRVTERVYGYDKESKSFVETTETSYSKLRNVGTVT
jgi:hypothetical protein